jgi:hypothetical protein
MFDIIKFTSRSNRPKYFVKTMTDSNTALLKSSEIDRASKILARAFGGDPMFRYLGIEVKPGQFTFTTYF